MDACVFLSYIRTGETEFAAIVRNRSGQDAGSIDFGLKSGDVIDALCDRDKQELVDTAFSLFLAIESATGRKATETTEIGRMREHGRRCKDQC
ncbi:hypothetical protein BH11ARM1_BH11ARM1_14270 [soil metagenome]